MKRVLINTGLGMTAALGLPATGGFLYTGQYANAFVAVLVTLTALQLLNRRGCLV